MRTRIKICGITRPEDGVVAATMGADAIGLVFFDKSPRHVDLETARRVIASLPPFVGVVGLFVDPSGDEVRHTLDALPLDMLQFHGDETPEFCAGFGRRYLKAVRVKPGLDLVAYSNAFRGAAGLLLDTWVPGTRGGTGETFDWNLVPRTLPLPVVLSGGLTPSNVGDAIRRLGPWAVDVSSGVEAAKGVKDPTKIAAFIRGVRDADQ